MRKRLMFVLCLSGMPVFAGSLSRSDVAGRGLTTCPNPSPESVSVPDRQCLGRPINSACRAIGLNGQVYPGVCSWVPSFSKNCFCAEEWALSFARGPSFFANPEIQSLAPNAFALQKESAAFVEGIGQSSLGQREALVKAIQSEPELKNAVASWQALTMEEQIPYLRRIFDVEVKVLGIAPPELVIQAGIISGPAYFDFDPTKPGTGKVILNPDALKKEENKYASLSLLIHETRHSAQFQMAFPVNPASVFSVGYEAAFIAQKSLKGKLSFCDFLTLLNEYEAFQFGNYVVGKLTGWKVDMLDMGTFASQYDSHGELKIDLVKVTKDFGQDRLLEKFNELEQVQKELLEIPRSSASF